MPRGREPASRWPPLGTLTDPSTRNIYHFMHHSPETSRRRKDSSASQGVGGMKVKVKSCPMGTKTASQDFPMTQLGSISVMIHNAHHLQLHQGHACCSLHLECCLLLYFAKLYPSFQTRASFSPLGGLL